MILNNNNSSLESTQKTDILKASPLLKVYEEDRVSKSSIPDFPSVKKSINNNNNLKKINYVSSNKLADYQEDVPYTPPDVKKLEANELKN